jgi:tetratricopeptide (TPR) repeat protein
MALYDALQTFQMRDDHAAALKYGEQAIAFLDSADPERKSPTTAYLLGRLHFRLGAIHSLRDQDHRAAMARFEKAVPLLQKPIPPEAMADVGRLGETFVSMGVSYWEAGQRKKAVELTAQGVSMIEHAVKQGTIEDGALAIPYTNLASMHRQLGASDAAARYQKLAAKAREGRVQ